jgi:hypothetical protein
MARRGFVDIHSHTVFFWSQKAACMTLFRTLAAAYGEGTRNIHFIRRSKPWQECLQLIHTEGYRSVVIARHPVLRAISCYLNKFCIYRDRPLTRRAQLEVFAQALHDRFCTGRGLQTDANVMSFEEFLATIATLFAERPDANAPSVNGHWDTQVPPAMVDAGFRYDRVVHVEQLNTEFAALCAELGLPFDASAVNATPIRPPAADAGYLGRTEARNVATGPFDHAGFLSQAVIDRVSGLYAPDFAMFGYPAVPAGMALRAG